MVWGWQGEIPGRMRLRDGSGQSSSLRASLSAVLQFIIYEGHQKKRKRSLARHGLQLLYMLRGYGLQQLARELSGAHAAG